MSYRIKEIWPTIQGEGFHSGRASIFVRFVGCNLWSGYEKDREVASILNSAQCPLWCDTDFTKEGSKTYTRPELIREIRKISEEMKRGSLIARPQPVVFTGGEPLLHLDQVLISELQLAGFPVHIETNGTLKLHERDPDWVTVSPKQAEHLLKIERADEIKLVAPDYLPINYPRLTKVASAHFLQPEDGPRYDDSLALILDLINRDTRWRISIQTHKILSLA